MHHIRAASHGHVHHLGPVQEGKTGGQVLVSAPCRGDVAKAKDVAPGGNGQIAPEARLPRSPLTRACTSSAVVAKAPTAVIAFCRPMASKIT